MSISLELAGSIRLLNPTALDPRTYVTAIDNVKNDPTLYIGFGPIFDSSTNRFWRVSAGDAVGDWGFSEMFFTHFDATAVNEHLGITSGNPHGVSKADVGLDNVTNHLQIPASEKGAASGVATLNSTGKLTATQLPDLSITDTFTAVNETEQIALTVQKGDVCVRSDENKSYILVNATNTSMLDWVELLSPTVTDTDSVPEGSSNLYYTDARVDTRITGKEDALGNPTTNGDILSSTTAGVRSWVTNDGILTEAVVPGGVGSVGGIDDGDTDLIIGLSFTDFAKKLLRKQTPPTYTAPTLSLGLTPTKGEIGADVQVTSTPLWNQRDGGTIVTDGVVFIDPNSNHHTQSTSAAYTDASQVILTGTNYYNLSIEYNQGPIKNDSLGSPYPTGRIPAGTVDAANESITGEYYKFFGEVDGIKITSSSNRADIATHRANAVWSELTFSNIFHVYAGTTMKNWNIVIPDGYTLHEVYDETNASDITSNFTNNEETTTEMPDGSAAAVYTAKSYLMTNAVTYGTDPYWKITITKP